MQSLWKDEQAEAECVETRGEQPFPRDIFLPMQKLPYRLLHHDQTEQPHVSQAQ